MSQPLLKLRLRECWPMGQQPHGDPERPIVEVLSRGLVVGQLPATGAFYKMSPNVPGEITITLRATDVNIQSHD